MIRRTRTSKWPPRARLRPQYQKKTHRQTLTCYLCPKVYILSFSSNIFLSFFSPFFSPPPFECTTEFPTFIGSRAPPILSSNQISHNLRLPALALTAQASFLVCFGTALSCPPHTCASFLSSPIPTQWVSLGFTALTSCGAAPPPPLLLLLLQQRLPSHRC